MGSVPYFPNLLQDLTASLPKFAKVFLAFKSGICYKCPE
jgi:hypothetical protein